MEILSFSVRLANPYLLSIKHQTKINISVSSAVIGLILGGSSRLIGNPLIGFIMSLAGSALVGLNMAFSECIIYGFLKAAPSKFVKPVIGGTGFAGVPAVFFRLLLLKFGVGFSVVCFGMAPIYVLQLAIFFYIRSTVITVREQHMEMKKIHHLPLEQEEALTNHNMNLPDLKYVLKSVGKDCFNIGAVFFMQYICLTSFADKANPQSEEVTGDFISEDFFLILHLCYHIGALLSRGSVLLFRIRYVGIVTLIQVICCLIYLSAAIWKWMSHIYQIPFMLFIGLLGGINYGNGMMTIMESPKLNRHVKELAVSVAEFSYVTGVILAAIGAVVVAKWIITE